MPAQVRKLPDPKAPSVVRMPSEIAEPAPEAPSREAPPMPRAPSPVPSPLGGKRFKIQFTGDQALCDKLREAQALLRHQVPEGDLAQIFDRALTLLLDDAKRKKFARTSKPRARSEASQKLGTPSSRHIPAEIKRAVVARDRGRCAFVGPNDRRCGSRDFLEFHHLDPWARSKRHSVDRIELRCRGHNQYAALQDYWSCPHGALRKTRPLPPEAVGRKAAGVSPAGSMPGFGAIGGVMLRRGYASVGGRLRR